jgi:hypothetical protein
MISLSEIFKLNKTDGNIGNVYLTLVTLKPISNTNNNSISHYNNKIENYATIPSNFYDKSIINYDYIIKKDSSSQKLNKDILIDVQLKENPSNSILLDTLRSICQHRCSPNLQTVSSSRSGGPYAYIPGLYFYL